MATIHLGRLVGPVGFSRAVAIKRLFDNIANDPDFVAMFLDEARIAARIRHPNVVPVLDVVSTETDLLLVMELVLGESLSFFMKRVRSRDARLPPSIAVSIVTQILHGLHAAHEAKDERGDPLGIVHRDVTPQNVLIGADGVARLTDFGIAKATGRVAQTRDGQIKGKIQYMSPEQLLSRPQDRRTDVYSASVVLWELLTGERLFWANTDAQSMYQVLEGELQRPSQVARDVPDGLDAVVMRGLDRDPSKRHVSAREMALELEAVMAPVAPSVIAAFVQAHAPDAVERIGKLVDMLDRVEAASGVEPPVPSQRSPRLLSLPPTPANRASMPSMAGELAACSEVADPPVAEEPTPFAATEDVVPSKQSRSARRDRSALPPADQSLGPRPPPRHTRVVVGVVGVAAGVLLAGLAVGRLSPGQGSVRSAAEPTRSSVSSPPEARSLERPAQPTPVLPEPAPTPAALSAGPLTAAAPSASAGKPQLPAPPPSASAPASPRASKQKKSTLYTRD